MTATNWSVITGAPSSGKTTLLRNIEMAGYHVIHEVARTLIETELAQGRTLAQIRADVKSFENRILETKIAIEARLAKNDVIFFDRAIPDSIAYFEMAGLDPGPAIAKSPSNHYRHVFLLDQLPYERDHARIEERETAAKLDRAIEKSYRMLGYEVTRIGIMPVEDRFRTILEALEEDRHEKKDRSRGH